MLSENGQAYKIIADLENGTQYIGANNPYLATGSLISYNPQDYYTGSGSTWGGSYSGSTVNPNNNTGTS